MWMPKPLPTTRTPKKPDPNAPFSGSHQNRSPFRGAGHVTCAAELFLCMVIVGITGGIASGKSTITRMLAEQGAETGSADADARAVLADDPLTLEMVLRTFPEAKTAEGHLDRAKLAARIFSDRDARERLEAILHPVIIARMSDKIAAARLAGPGVLAYETPLLYEARLEPLFDKVIAALATPELQRARLQVRASEAGRDPLTEDELTARLGAQMPPEEKARRADFVIRTDGSLAATGAQVREVWEQLTRRDA